MGHTTTLAIALAIIADLTSASAIKRAGGYGKAQPIQIPMRQSNHGPAFDVLYGTPPQKMTMLDDWTWHSNWVYTPHCKDHYSIPDCVLPGQNYFDYQKSSTFKTTNDADQTWIGTDYTPGAPFTVSFGTDKMCLPNGKKPDGLCQNEIKSQISNLAFSFPYVEDIGGIIGSAPVLKGLDSTYQGTLPQLIQKANLDPILGWHMCASLKSKNLCQDQDFLSIYGGTNTELYNQDKMQYHDIVVSKCINAGNLKLTPARDNYWSASWTGFWIGDQKIDLATPTTAQPDPPDPSCGSIDPIAIFDEGGFGRGAPIPLNAFNTLTSVTKATVINATSAVPLNNGKQGLWSVDCGSVDKLPNLVYELSGKQKIVVEPRMYIDKDNVVKGKCLLNARTWDRATAGAQTFFGVTVLQRSYLKFDFDALKVGVAPVKQEHCR